MSSLPTIAETTMMPEYETLTFTDAVSKINSDLELRRELNETLDLYRECTTDDKYGMERETPIASVFGQVVPAVHLKSNTIFYVARKQKKVTTPEGVVTLVPMYVLVQAVKIGRGHLSEDPFQYGIFKAFTSNSPLSNWSAPKNWEGVQLPPFEKGIIVSKVASALYRACNPSQWPSQDEVKKWGVEREGFCTKRNVKDEYLDIWNQSCDVSEVMPLWTDKLKEVYTNVCNMTKPGDLKDVGRQLPFVLIKDEEKKRFSFIAEGTVDRVLLTIGSRVWGKECFLSSAIEVEANDFASAGNWGPRDADLATCINKETGEILLDKVSKIFEKIGAIGKEVDDKLEELGRIRDNEGISEEEKELQMMEWVNSLKPSDTLPINTIIRFLTRIIHKSHYRGVAKALIQKSTYAGRMEKIFEESFGILHEVDKTRFTSEEIVELAQKENGSRAAKGAARSEAAMGSAGSEEGPLAKKAKASEEVIELD